MARKTEEKRSTVMGNVGSEVAWYAKPNTDIIANIKVGSMQNQVYNAVCCSDIPSTADLTKVQHIEK